MPMTGPRRYRILTLMACLAATSATSAAAQPAILSIVSAGPRGEVGSLAEANEVRIVFSEPMVSLGRIPETVTAPFFSISPAAGGTFRWSGTTTLIFTPDPKRRLPFATRYQVTIAESAAAVSGRRLAAPFTFSFRTPTARLLRTTWSRRGGRADAPIVALLRFNQPVRAADVLAHLQGQFEPHDWAEPSLSDESIAQMTAADPEAVGRFRAKVAATRASVAATGRVQVRLTDDWDKKH